jgi:hypothetical protein
MDYINTKIKELDKEKEKLQEENLIIAQKTKKYNFTHRNKNPRKSQNFLLQKQCICDRIMGLEIYFLI